MNVGEHRTTDQILTGGIQKNSYHLKKSIFRFDKEKIKKSALT